MRNDFDLEEEKKPDLSILREELRTNRELRLTVADNKDFVSIEERRAFFASLTPEEINTRYNRWAFSVREKLKLNKPYECEYCGKTHSTCMCSRYRDRDNWDQMQR